MAAALISLALFVTPILSRSDDSGRSLLLSVSINGHPTNLIAQFVEQHGALFAPASQLRGLGLETENPDPETLISLAAFPGLTYSYDERGQTLDISIGDAGRIPTAINLRPMVELVTPEAGWGGVFSYDLLTDYFHSSEAGDSTRLAGTGEFRFFTPFAVATNSVLGEIDDHGDRRFIRLESRVTADGPDRTMSYRLGDFVTGGSSWSRPVRTGGIQVATNFALRPDIITFPVPEISGTSAAPATLDIFVNNIRRASVPVEPGPFQIDGLPVMSGAGDVSLVVRDMLGREVVTTMPFYASTGLLDSGLTDLSVEAGFLREDFGTYSNSYSDVFLSGSARHGLTDWATLEAHAEATEKTGVIGGGVTVTVPRFGLFRAAGAGSQGVEGAGALASLGFEHQGGPFSFRAEALGTTANYSDIASVNGDEFPDLTSRFSFGWSPAGWGSLSLSYTRIDDRSLEDAQIVSASYSRPLFKSRAHFSATGFSDVITGAYGVGASIFIPLGDLLFGSAGVQGGSEGGITGRADLVKQAPVDSGLGYRVSLSQGAFTQREVEAIWDNRTVDMNAVVSQGDSGFGARIGAAGSIAALGGGLWLSDRINNGFVIVEVGNFEGVEVMRENRLVGRTDASGRLFVNDVRAYDGNNISINPLDLPIDADLATTDVRVATRGGSGRIVRFEASQSVTALVTVTFPDGSYPPAGSSVAVAGGEVFVLGFDGQAFLTGLSANNSAVVSWADGKCHLEFLAAPGTGQIQTIPVICR